jgi:hypothetical protein
MCFRKSVGESYLRVCASDPRRKLLPSRVGKGMFGGEDADLCYVACGEGWGMGRFPELRLTHLIPARKLTVPYLCSLFHGFGASTVVLNHLHGIPDYMPKGDLLARSAFIIRLFLAGRHVDARIRWAELTGRIAGRRLLRKASAPEEPNNEQLPVPTSR